MKVIITGPESTGKSWLTRSLAEHYNIPYAKEYARQYLEQTGGAYEEKDLLKIARGQANLEEQVRKQKPQIILCDTGIEVIRIWSEWKYGRCDEHILKLARDLKPELYLLLKPDIPWVQDPLRENPTDRQELF